MLTFGGSSIIPPQPEDGKGRLFPELPSTGKLMKVCGAVAQLGERLVRNEEASGSIPLSSTNSFPFSSLTF
jgi:hypothetical protein